MKSQLRAGLLQLAPLASSGAALDVPECKVCTGRSIAFDVVDFNKTCSTNYYPFGFSGIQVAYYQCQTCGFVFSNFFDDWTTEEFSQFVYNADYRLVDGEYAEIRPTRLADHVAPLLAQHRGSRILDYGSGSGVFAEQLRAHEFAAVEGYDPFSSPARPSGRFDIITCFETIEHSPSPREAIRDLQSFIAPGGCIIFSTGIQPANIEEVRANWWYIAPRNGHVSIYTLPALASLGADVGLDLYSDDGFQAFAGAHPAPHLMELLRTIGPTRSFARLTAPGDQPSMDFMTSEADWHGIEQSGANRFRWTQRDRVEWKLLRQPANYPCRLSVTIPVVNEITPGFAEQCRIEIDGTIHPLRRETGNLTATVELERRLDRPIVLLTPPLGRPSELRGTTDNRALGLAMPVATGCPTPAG